MAGGVGPITPDEVPEMKQVVIPETVFAAFNELIAKRFSAGSAEVLQCDVVEKLVEQGFDEEEIFANGWLNVEEAYRAAGWEVVYDKPGYNETYPASFTFRRR